MKGSYHLIIIGVFILAFILGIFLFSGDKECKWENYYQGSFGSASVYRDIGAGSEFKSGGFVTPLGIDYEEVEFKEFGVIATNKRDGSRFMLNDIDCGILSVDTFAFNDFSTTCLNALREGFNNFNSTSRIITSSSGTNYSSSDVIIHEIYVGMRYKPANCD